MRDQSPRIKVEEEVEKGGLSQAWDAAWGLSNAFGASLLFTRMPFRSFPPYLDMGGGSKGCCRECLLELAQLKRAGRLRTHRRELGVGSSWKDTGRSRRLSGICKSGGVGVGGRSQDGLRISRGTK